ncbi:MAG: hypothetical protein J7604_22620 [Sporocytophaga sp.]|uniref:hypothetical protein n=1 Tax=Sporocytophaga sp. TaxID=2231183 RepID=UPI001B206DC8|nr:hypothetical protein [Sporocytophaga sp.]MBO9703026.1 hypothetical protein [Sporocytophaga sp.]
MKGILKILVILLQFSFSSIKNSKPEIFVFISEDVFQLSDGRLIVSGQIKSGNINKNERLIVKVDNSDKLVIIQQMEVFGKPNGTETGVKGDFVAFTISDIAKDKIGKGTVFLKKI